MSKDDDAQWLRLSERLRNAIDEIDNSFNTNTDFNMITIWMLFQVFERQTIAAAIGRTADDDVWGWIERGYDDWCKDFNDWLSKDGAVQSPPPRSL